MEAAGGGHCQEALPVNQRVTWEGCSVLLDINDGDRLVFARLSSGATLKIGNKKCSLRALIGSPFGSLFNVKAGPNGSYLARCTTSTFNENAFVLQDKGSWQSTGESKDNRSLVDNNTAQGLSSEDIDAMKRQSNFREGNFALNKRWQRRFHELIESCDKIGISDDNNDAENDDLYKVGMLEGRTVCHIC